MKRKLLTNGSAFKRTDGRWGGVVWYMDESGERKRKSFSSTSKQEVNKKITAYIATVSNQPQIKQGYIKPLLVVGVGIGKSLYVCHHVRANSQTAVAAYRNCNTQGS